jgi:hypothetical protein
MACLITTSTYTGGDDFTAADRLVSELGDPGASEWVSLDDLRALLGTAAAA